MSFIKHLFKIWFKKGPTDFSGSFELNCTPDVAFKRISKYFGFMSGFKLDYKKIDANDGVISLSYTTSDGISSFGITIEAMENDQCGVDVEVQSQNYVADDDFEAFKKKISKGIEVEEQAETDN
jgi:hypothetical protein